MQTDNTDSNKVKATDPKSGGRNGKCPWVYVRRKGDTGSRLVRPRPEVRDLTILPNGRITCKGRLVSSESQKRLAAFLFAVAENQSNMLDLVIPSIRLIKIYSRKTKRPSIIAEVA